MPSFLSHLLLAALLLATPPIARAASTTPATSPATTPTTSPATPQPNDLYAALFQLFKDAGIPPTNATRPDQTHCTLIVTATTARLQRALQSLESSKLLIRHDAISIQTPNPGTDDLRVEMRFTLNTPPAAGIPFTDVLRDLTAVFAQNFPAPNSIWLTAFSCDNTTQTWQVQGQCTAERFPTQLAAAIKDSPRFQNPILTTTPDPDRPNLFTFKISFQLRRPLT